MKAVVQPLDQRRRSGHLDIALPEHVLKPLVVHPPVAQVIAIANKRRLQPWEEVR